MLQQDCAAFCRLDQRGVHVAGDVLLRPLGVALRHFLLTPFRQSRLAGRHRHHVLEAVAAVDSHILGHRTESVRRIEIGVALGMREASPQPFVTILKQNRAQVVQVRGFAVQQCAEHAFAHHAQDGEFTVAVAAVLHHQAMPTRLFRGLDQFPAILDAGRDGHFAGGVFAGTHGGQRHRRVPGPRRGGVDEIDVVALHEPLKIALAVEEQRRLGLPCFRDHGRRATHLVFHHVAERGDTDALDGEQFAQHGSATQAGADDRNAHRVVFGEWHAEHAAISGRAGVCEIDAPVIGCREQPSRSARQCAGGERSGRSGQQFAP